MPHTSLGRLYAAVRLTLHLLFAALVAFAVVRALVDPTAWTPWVIAAGAALVAVYVLGTVAARRSVAQPWVGEVWLGAVSVLWLVLLVLTPDAAYLVFPLFFLYLHLLRVGWALACVVVATVVAVCGLGVHGQWSVGGVVGPLVAAAVAIVLGLTYRAMTAQQQEREQILRELVATQEELAASERRAGALDERARLARDIHDTVAQGLASIQLLLHAAERADPDGPGVERMRQARATAAENLAEARRIIGELTPEPIERDGLAASLRRLGARTTERSGIAVEVDAPSDLELSTQTQTALLRVAQGAVSNVVRHSGAGRAGVRLAADDGDVVLEVRDDGCGFDPTAAGRRPGDGDSFGLRAIRERVEQLDGFFDLTAAPGAGTTLTVRLHRGEET